MIDFAPAMKSLLGAVACVLALGCGGQTQTNPREAPTKKAETPTPVDEALQGLETAYGALCACRQHPPGECDLNDFDGYDPAAMRETLQRHVERGDGYTECIRDLARGLSVCLSVGDGCDDHACPGTAALLDDNTVLDELGES